jgi:hypothetical protein
VLPGEEGSYVLPARPSAGTDRRGGVLFTPFLSGGRYGEALDVRLAKANEATDPHARHRASSRHPRDRLGMTAPQCGYAPYIE